MGRFPRIHFPGAIYHVMARGVDGRDIYPQTRDREIFLAILNRLRTEADFSVLAYCLMGNHFHLALKVSSTPLSPIMHRLLTRFALIFNTEYSRKGHLFQSRFKANLCLNDRYLLGLIRYIHMNPVRAGLVEHPSRWPWSSYQDYIGGKGPVYVDRENLPKIIDESERNLSFVERMSREPKDFVAWPRENKAAPVLIRNEATQRQTIDEIATRLSVQHRIPQEIIRTTRRRRDISIIRKKLVQMAIREGHTLSAIAFWLGCSLSNAHFLLNGRIDSTNRNNRRTGTL